MGTEDPIPPNTMNVAAPKTDAPVAIQVQVFCA